MLPKSLSELGNNALPNSSKAILGFIDVHKDNENYSSLDGILYSKDKKTLIACPIQYKSAEYQISNEVNEIAANAFKGNNNIRKIIIPESVTTIGESAFAEMVNLEEVIFPTNFEYLNKSLFENCEKLNAIKWPENVHKIDEKCFFKTGLEALVIPDTVEKIGNYAFAFTKLKSAILPKTVSEIGLSVFAGIPSIEVYDTIDGNAKPAKDYVDSCNGCWNGMVGFIGIRQRERQLGAACNADWYEHSITVRSSFDDSIKYTVRMPTGQKRKVYCTYASSWGKNAEFNFNAIDKIFKDLTADAKLDYIFERLHYQEGITDEALESYNRYISRNVKDIIAKIMKSDDVNELEFFGQYEIVKKTTYKDCLQQADTMNAVQCKAWLLEWERKNNVDDPKFKI